MFVPLLYLWNIQNTNKQVNTTTLLTLGDKPWMPTGDLRMEARRWWNCGKTWSLKETYQGDKGAKHSVEHARIQQLLHFGFFFVNEAVMLITTFPPTGIQWYVFCYKFVSIISMLNHSIDQCHALLHCKVDWIRLCSLVCMFLSAKQMPPHWLSREVTWIMMAVEWLSLEGTHHEAGRLRGRWFSPTPQWNNTESLVPWEPR